MCASLFPRMLCIGTRYVGSEQQQHQQQKETEGHRSVRLLPFFFWQTDKKEKTAEFIVQKFGHPSQSHAAMLGKKI